MIAFASQIRQPTAFLDGKPFYGTIGSESSCQLEVVPNVYPYKPFSAADVACLIKNGCAKPGDYVRCGCDGRFCWIPEKMTCNRCGLSGTA